MAGKGRGEAGRRAREEDEEMGIEEEGRAGEREQAAGEEVRATEKRNVYSTVWN